MGFSNDDEFDQDEDVAEPDLIDDLPIKKEKKNARKIRIRRKDALSSDQTEELIKKAYAKSEKVGLMIETQVKSGLRINEFVNLLVSNLNFSSGDITVEYIPEDQEKNIKEFTGKTASAYRTIPLEPGIKDKLQKYVQENQIKFGYLFRPYKKSERKNHYTTNSVINVINELAMDCNSIGRTIGSHALRRTFASVLLNQGVPITRIQKLLGHKHLKTTLVYLKDVWSFEVDNKVRDAISKIGKKEG